MKHIHCSGPRLKMASLTFGSILTRLAPCAGARATLGAPCSYHVWCSMFIPSLMLYVHTIFGAPCSYHVWCSVLIPCLVLRVLTTFLHIRAENLAAAAGLAGLSIHGDAFIGRSVANTNSDFTLPEMSPASAWCVQVFRIPYSHELFLPFMLSLPFLLSSIPAHSSISALFHFCFLAYTRTNMRKSLFFISPIIFSLFSFCPTPLISHSRLSKYSPHLLVYP